ncbi:DUF1289 domain-containing protein [Thalassotalea castellviae]|uniref:DUF1289 domain-containing protein n=1 Tax=Thalassotalea castellviae TaxID=3075612 RepID=A0ABU3A3U4_9GAMM|nr:DUF1289 domain-containing protein [Thalassotalea sp. W431]MDT0604851.1 DUF1289 domain-containing protein [Thalassotalea sp. W431]
MFVGNNNQIITPCIGQCHLDASNVCNGCYRTSSEITSWIDKSDDEKIAIVIRCKKHIEAKQNTSY